jgi:hypothetical protein
MPPTITRINPQGGSPYNEDSRMQVTKSNGTIVEIDISDYIKFQKEDGTVVYGRVYAFSIGGAPDSFAYYLGPNLFGPALTNSELDSLENLGKQRPPQWGAGRKNRRGTKKVRRNRRRSTRRSIRRN